MNKFVGSIVINKPIDMVVKLFMDSSNLNEYQDGFQKKVLVAGQAGEEGCESTLYYKYGKRDLILTEKVIKNNLPESFEAFYHHKHMDNTMKCSFTVLDNYSTKFEYEYEYTRINWIIPRLMFILFPRTFKNQGDKWNQQFKMFVERQ